MHGVRRLLVPAIAAAFVALPATAHAATPCRDRVYNEWYATGKVSTKHPVACYRDALKHIPTDAAVYSDLDSSIRQALQVALTRQHAADPTRVPSSVGTGLRGPQGPHETKAARKTKTQRTTTQNTTIDRAHPERGPQRTHTEAASDPVASATSSSGGPALPILVLGAIAIALAAAGGIGTGVRWLRRH